MLASSLPRYKCHKEVSAVKIAAIIFAPLPEFKGALCRGCVAFGTACGQCERCLWYRENGTNRNAVIQAVEPGVVDFTVDAQYLAKHKPEVGGYFVVYEDGYQSFSPAKAFEDRYTPAEMNALELGAAVRAAGLQGQ